MAIPLLAAGAARVLAGVGQGVVGRAGVAGARNIGRGLAAAGRGASAPGDVSRIADGVQSAKDALEKLEQTIIPKFAHTITVSVKGGPAASLRRCWYLCLAALFGRRRRSVGANWAEAFNANWDITGKQVTASLAFTSGTTLDAAFRIQDSNSPAALIQRGPDQVTVGAGLPGFLSTLTQNVQQLVGVNGVRGAGLRVKDANNPVADPIPPAALAQLFLPGPVRNLAAKQVDPLSGVLAWSVDDRNPFGTTTQTTLFHPYAVQGPESALLELPIQQGSGQLLPYRKHAPITFPRWEFVRRGRTGWMPVLPDEGRVITTGIKIDPRVQNPKPPVDGWSRGHTLTMITAELASPGALVSPPRMLTDGANNFGEALGSNGLYVWTPGTQWTDEDLYTARPWPQTELTRSAHDIAAGLLPNNGNVPYNIPTVR